MPTQSSNVFCVHVCIITYPVINGTYIYILADSVPCSSARTRRPCELARIRTAFFYRDDPEVHSLALWFPFRSLTFIRAASELQRNVYLENLSYYSKSCCLCRGLEDDRAGGWDRQNTHLICKCSLSAVSNRFRIQASQKGTAEAALDKSSSSMVNSNCLPGLTIKCPASNKKPALWGNACSV